LNGWATPDLRPVLDNTVIFARRFDHLSPFPDAVGAGFFYINIFARLAGPDGSQRVPVVGRGERNGIDGFVLQKFSDVGIAHRSFTFRLLKLVQPPIENVFIDITQSSHFHID
jgi:hypothetical protein